jgi:hypothetical protein
MPDFAIVGESPWLFFQLNRVVADTPALRLMMVAMTAVTVMVAVTVIGRIRLRVGGRWPPRSVAAGLWLCVRN